MPQSDDPIHQLLEWEQEARRLVDEAKAQAQAIQDDAKQQRQERLIHAQHEAKIAAEHCRSRILEETGPICRSKMEEAHHTAAAIREAAAPHVNDAAHAALRWLLFEEVEHVSRRTIR